MLRGMEGGEGTPATLSVTLSSSCNSCRVSCSSGTRSRADSDRVAGAQPASSNSSKKDSQRRRAGYRHAALAYGPRLDPGGRGI